MLEPILVFVADIAWPITIGAIALVYKKDMTLFLERVNKAKIGSFELETEKKSKELLTDAIKLGSGNERIIESVVVSSETSEKDRYEKIVNARNLLNQKIISISKKYRLVEEDQNPDQKIIPSLIHKLRGVLPSRDIMIIGKVGEVLATAEDILREPSVSESAVNDLVDASEIMGESLDKLLANPSDKIE